MWLVRMLLKAIVYFRLRNLKWELDIGVDYQEVLRYCDPELNNASYRFYTLLGDVMLEIIGLKPDENGDKKFYPRISLVDKYHPELEYGILVGLNSPQDTIEECEKELRNYYRNFLTKGCVV